MATLLCHITIKPGRVSEFEAVMREMYRRTHAEEPNCIRYEYFRAARENSYYCLLSFTDRLSFLQHQVSDYHEGHDFAGMIEALEMEWVDPVDAASPLGQTEEEALSPDAEEALQAASELYPVTVQGWWQAHRSGES